MSLLLPAAPLASHHSHVCGAALLAVLVAATLGTPRTRPLTRTVLLAGIMVPTLTFAIAHFGAQVPFGFAVLLVGCALRVLHESLLSVPHFDHYSTH